MMINKSKILEAIERGIDQAMQFDLNDYDNDEIYISKKKINLDKEDKAAEIAYEESKLKIYADRLLENDLDFSDEEKEDFLKIAKLGKYLVKDNKLDLQALCLRYCFLFGQDADLNWIDTSNITDMSNLFMNDVNFNGDISKWNTANVRDMSFMFMNATNFNQDISNWNTRLVEDMSFMFCNAKSFNQPIGKWNVSNVENMSRMFENAILFRQDVSEWDVKNVKNANNTFNCCLLRDNYKFKI